MTVVGAAFLYANSAKHIDRPIEVEISRGSTLNDAAKQLKEAGVVRSALAFQTLVLLMGGERDIVAGVYEFSSTIEAKRVVERLRAGAFESNSLAITFPEGLTVKNMSSVLANRLPDFDEAEFLELAQDEEGYLFPDTYFFHRDADPAEIITRMKENFSLKTENLQRKDSLEGVDIKDIIKMASILEAEATDLESRQIVSGILWERLDQGVPLQVDAAFLYIEELEGKNTYSLTKEDLKIESPYNTYVNKGLPPTPINNPGEESIYAAANPIASDYLFYLSDTKGNMYYAKTFEDHIENRVFLDH